MNIKHVGAGRCLPYYSHIRGIKPRVTALYIVSICALHKKARLLLRAKVCSLILVGVCYRVYQWLVSARGYINVMQDLSMVSLSDGFIV